jgi:hypothetical protein
MPFGMLRSCFEIVLMRNSQYLNWYLRLLIVQQ